MQQSAASDRLPVDGAGLPFAAPRGDSGELLHAMFGAALQASYPEGKFAGKLPARPKGRTIVLGAGKAAARMAAAFEAEWDGPLSGLVITRYGHRFPTRQIEVVEAAHPVPDPAGLAAASRLIALARQAGEDDLVIFLVSGGASALLVAPVEGLSFAAKQELNRQLLRSGAPISAMNVVRKSISAVKGGRLARLAAPAQVVTYVISDVPGDDPAVIGSGPTVIGDVDPDEVMAVLGQYEVEVPPEIAALLGRRVVLPPLATGPIHLLASPRLALEAAATLARQAGVTPLILGDAIEGEAREVGTVMAGIAKSVRRWSDPVAAPCVLLSGGETTVTVRGSGRGGRNAEFLLALAASMGTVPCAAIACDTDGIDGSEDNAGAWFDESLAARAELAEQKAYLHRNDAYSYFERLGLLTRTGPTLTNVNDFRAVLLRP